MPYMPISWGGFGGHWGGIDGSPMGRVWDGDLFHPQGELKGEAPALDSPRLVLRCGIAQKMHTIPASGPLVEL